MITLCVLSQDQHGMYTIHGNFLLSGFDAYALGRCTRCVNNNTSVKTPTIQFVTYAPRGSLGFTLCVRFNIYALRLGASNLALA